MQRFLLYCPASIVRILRNERNLKEFADYIQYKEQ